MTVALTACLSTEPEPPDDVGAAAPAPQNDQVALVTSPMIVVPGLEEPLVSTKRTSHAEDRAINRAIDEFREFTVDTMAEPAEHGIENLAPFERFVEAYPSSGWSAAVFTDLGLGYYYAGYFSRALDAWDKAWQEGKAATEPMAKALVDRAVGELARMHARVGHADELEALFKDIGKRPLTGPATEMITGAHEGAWEMRNNPGDAYLCGPKALSNTLRALGASPKATAFADEARSGAHGFSLEQVARLADDGGMPHRLIYREPGQAIPVPSVINWKVHHYAAIISEENGRYHIKDPTFGGDLDVSRAAIDAEGSGYFLVPSGGAEDAAWRDATPEEAQSVYGMGFVGGSQPDATKPGDPKIRPDCGVAGHGMCVPNAHAMLVSLNLEDTPVGYAPQKGPPVFIRLTYNQREYNQQGNIPYGNVSSKWTLNMLSYVRETDMLGTAGVGVSRFVNGGGSVTYVGYAPSATIPNTGAFTPEMQTGAILTRTPLNGIATSYTLTSPDGSQMVYDVADGALSTIRLMFLTKIIDSQGNFLTLTYDTSGVSRRLISITDAALRTTTFSYGTPGSPLLVTSITDPFGRSASLIYGGTGCSAGGLCSIRDVLNIVSSFNYDVIVNGMNLPSGLTLTTPYGMSTFRWDEGPPGDTDPHMDHTWWRSLELTDPAGSTERVEYKHQAPGVETTEVNEMVPNEAVPCWYGPALPFCLDVTPVADYYQWRNTFYWDKHAYAMYGAGPSKDYLKAKRWHWLHNTANPQQTSPFLESTKEPFEGRVWYNYPGQELPPPTGPSFIEGTSGLVNATARKLGDGATALNDSTQVYKTSYNALGKPLTTKDPYARVTEYMYFSNNLDLQLVRQQISTTPTYAVLASYTYNSNSKHEPATMTDAAGKLWQYTYNAYGQLETVTDPLNRVTRYNHDMPLGRLTTVVNANNATVLTNTYAGNSDLPQTVMDSEGRTLIYQRDALDRVTQITYPDATTDKYSYLKPADMTPQLDLQTYTDRLGRITTYEYYPENRRLKSVKDPLLQTVQYTYYRNGVLNTLKDEKNNLTTWEIDIQSRPTKKIFHDGKFIQYGYEHNTSRLKTITDQLSQVKTFGYNRDDTLATITYTNAVNPTPNVSFAYDPFFERRTGMTDGIGSTVWNYVPVGTKGALSVLTEDGPFTNDLVTYGYDELGRKASQKVDTDTTETWHYDPIGRPDIHVNALGTFNYAFNGQTSAPVSRLLAGTNVSTFWAYDTNVNDRRLVDLSNGNGARDYTIGYERWDVPTGQNPYHVTSVYQNASGLPPALLSCYAYDTADRLTSVSKPTSPSGTCRTAQTSLYNYAYDPANNATTFRSATSTTNPTYNTVNQIVTNGAQSFTFTSAGNETADGTRTFKWDAENRMAQVTSSSVTTTVRYDGLGRRRELARPGTTERFVWCGSKICAKRDASGTLLASYFDEGQYGGATKKWITTPDHLGNVRDVISVQNNVGTLVSSVDYTPYGQTKTKSGTEFPDFMYGGMYEHRTHGGIQYSQTRTYDPGIGRWISRDPIGETGGINLYGYVEGDPINETDPSGLRPIDPCSPRDRDEVCVDPTLKELKEDCIRDCIRRTADRDEDACMDYLCRDADGKLDPNCAMSCMRGSPKNTREACEKTCSGQAGPRCRHGKCLACN